MQHSLTVDANAAADATLSMATRGKASRHEARMQRVASFIDSHLGQPLPLDRLSEVAASSKFHFHRQFHAWTGMPVYSYVQNARLHLACFRLAYRPDTTITEVAYDCGYRSPEAFSRNFKGFTGQTPSAFRNDPKLFEWYDRKTRFSMARRHTALLSLSTTDVVLASFPLTRIAEVEHLGNPAAMPMTIRKFIAWRRQSGIGPRTATFNVLHTALDGPDEFRMGIGAAISWDTPICAAGVSARVIPAGRVARLRLRGSGDDLRQATAFLYGVWLPASGAKPRDFPLLVQRHTMFPDVPESSAITDLLLPIQ